MAKSKTHKKPEEVISSNAAAEVKVPEGVAANHGITANELQTMASDLLTRTGYASQMGLSYDGDRDLYAALGYPRVLNWVDFQAKYKREALGKRIINAFPDATWKGVPILKGNKALSTAWKKLQKELKVVSYFGRADRLAGIGRYATLLLGFNDGKPLDKEVSFNAGRKLNYLSPFSELNAQVSEFETDAKKPRYGQVKTYSVKLADDKPAQIVHWTRILHIAEGLQEDEVYGTPRLECVYNRLEDVQKIAGGSGEMFWRGAFPGYAFLKDADADIKDQSLAAMQGEIDDFIHNLSRYLRLQGMDVKELKPQVANPNRHMMTQLQLISGGVGIPLRILIGSERGELASSEDRKSWHERVQERQLDFGELVVVRPFIDRCMMAGVLAKAEYDVTWPPLDVLTAQEAAEVGAVKAKTIQSYVTSGGDVAVPIAIFLRELLGFDEELVAEIMDVIDANLKLEEADIAAVEEEDAQEEEE